MKILRFMLARLRQATDASVASEIAKLKSRIRKLQADAKESSDRITSDDMAISKLQAEIRESDTVVDSLHERILSLEHEKCDLEVKCEKLENTKMLNALAIETLTEMVQSHLEFRRTERLSAAAEAYFLNQQVSHNATDRTQRHHRTDQPPA